MPKSAAFWLPHFFSSSLVALALSSSQVGLAASLSLSLEGQEQATEKLHKGLLAKKDSKKKKKKKKKKEDDDDFGPVGIAAMDHKDQFTCIHTEQEGIDTPYIAEVAGSTALGMLTKKATDNDPASSTTLDIDGHILFILGNVGIGPDIGIKYESQSQKQFNPTTNAKETVESTSTSMRGGVLAKYYFGNIDKSLNVFFAQGGMAYQNFTSKSGDTKSEGSGSILRLGGGINMFLDSNIALAPQLDYVVDSRTSKADKDLPGSKDETTETSGIRVLLELATFL